MNLFKSFKSTISNIASKFRAKQQKLDNEIKQEPVEINANNKFVNDFEGWKEILRNDKEHIVIKQHTKTKEVRKYWYGVLMDIKNFGQFSKIKGIS